MITSISHTKCSRLRPRSHICEDGQLDPDMISLEYDEAICKSGQGKELYVPDKDTILFRPKYQQPGEVEYGSEDVSDEDEDSRYPFPGTEQNWSLNRMKSLNCEFADTTSDSDFDPDVFGSLLDYLSSDLMQEEG